MVAAVMVISLLLLRPVTTERGEAHSRERERVNYWLSAPRNGFLPSTVDKRD